MEKEVMIMINTIKKKGNEEEVKEVDQNTNMTNHINHTNIKDNIMVNHLNQVNLIEEKEVINQDEKLMENIKEKT